MEKLSHTKIILSLVVLTFFLFMFGNDIVSLTHPDEVFYTQTAKEMLIHNEWMTPLIFDRPQFEKPVLTFWLLMLAMKTFGISAAAARFFPALFGMIGVVATYGLAVFLFGKKRLAFLSAVILATSLIYVTLSRAVLTDMIFSIWVVLSLVSFYFGYAKRRYQSVGIILCFIFSALAVLTKGILGVIFPLIVIFGFLSFRGESDFFKTKATVWGLALFIAIAVPWHIIMLKQYGQFFIDEYVKNVHIRRIFEAEHQKSNTWYFYPFTVFAGVFPWNLFLFPAGYVAYESVRKNKEDRGQIVFLIFWIVFIIGVMQAAQSKLASYIFPAFPAVAIILGYYLEHVFLKKDSRLIKVWSLLAGIMAGLLLILAAGAIVYSKKNSALVVDFTPVYLLSFLSVISALAIFIFLKRRQDAGVICSLSSVTVIILAFLFFGHTYAEPWVSCKQISDAFLKKDSSHSAILCSKFFVRGVRYYTDRDTAVIDINGSGFFSPHPIPFLSRDGEVLTFLKSRPVTYCILKKSNVKDLERIVGREFHMDILEEIGGKYLLKVRKI